MTNLGPLTTTFTPDPECTSVISGIVFTQTGADGSTTEHQYQSLGPSDTSKCYPPAFEPTSVFYSPGICPSGWVSACGTADIIGGTVTETRVTCCPLGYSCIPAPLPTETWSTLSCSSSAISTVNMTVPDLSNQYSKVTELSGIIINAAAVTVRWQQTDFGAHVTDTPTVSSNSSSSSSTSSSSSVSVALAPPPNYSTDVSTVIGLGTGLGSLFLILSGVSFWYWRKRKGNKALKPQNSTAVKIAEPPVPMSPRELWEQYQQEMQTINNTHEMITSHSTHEVSGMSRPAELPSEGRL
ncbi:hypothetical protein F4804DRAFT_314328 [Jackrogersella minutella]|nr:hypothetical protein F4804DRAFT_314328 [Jackrogersella minutella]